MRSFETVREHRSTNDGNVCSRSGGRQTAVAAARPRAGEPNFSNGPKWQLRPPAVWIALVLCGALVLCDWCGALRPPAVHAQITMRDVTTDTGVDFCHFDGSGGHYYIMETVTAGLALFDYDGDGYIDIYFLNGAPLRGTVVDVAPRNALYRNEGNWRFRDVTEQAGLGDVGFGLGVAAGDFDCDGDLDLYVNNCGPNVMYRNNGDGTFDEVTREAGTRCGDKVGAGTAFLDADADGDLDLYVANYVKFAYDMPRPKTFRGVTVYPTPEVYQAEPDALFRNNGDGTFTDVSAESGIGQHAEWGMGMVCGDFDRDGDTDVFVCDDSTHNLLFQNDGHGKFEEAGLFAGVAYEMNGKPLGSMGADCADFDNDGWLDLYQTCFQREWATLYRNLGDGYFVDATHATGAGAGTYPHVTWGNGFADFDNDGYRDLFVACGHLNDKTEEIDPTSSYEAQNILLRNTGDGKFVDVSNSSGDGLRVRRSSRGSGFDDLDNDGDIDVVILNSRREPTILRNETVTVNGWAQIELVSRHTCPGGVGARVTLVAGDLTLVDEVHSGRSYQSHYGMRLHFGLGQHKHIDRLEVHWIGGQAEVWYNLPVNRRITVVEGDLLEPRIWSPVR